MLSFHLGPLAIPISLTIVVAAWLAAHGAGRGRRVSVAAHLNDMLLWGFVAARVGFVLYWFSLYSHRPLTMLDLRDGGFLPWAGIAAALTLAAWRGWRRPGTAPPAGRRRPGRRFGLGRRRGAATKRRRSRAVSARTAPVGRPARLAAGPGQR
ncbi:prolipoprotein diacylglyceryl transferase [Chromobacterium haemolyticum]|nr:prolipoprotein diacylglyceryl transferase [Chromobacterium haemolyticum]